MKVLALGDFHGKFNLGKFKKLVKNEEIDLVVSNGDFVPFSLRKIFFDKIYGKSEKELWDVVGRKKYKQIRGNDFKNAREVVKKLDQLGVQVITVQGNNDECKYGGAGDFKRAKSDFKWENGDHFVQVFKGCKNVKLIDYSFFKFKDFVFIGKGGSSFPGHVQSKGFKSLREKQEKLFKKFRKENKAGKVIYLSHNVPHDTKLDLITDKDAHKKAKGKHYGCKIVRRLINKWQPILSLGGHIHERQGKQKLGKTLAVNVGSVSDGQYSILDIDDKGKVKVRFVK